MSKVYDVENKEGIILRDYLARDRTELAAERTFLAYVRTALGLFSAGIAIIKIIADMPSLYVAGIIMLVASPFFLIIGSARFVRVKKKISTIPDNHLIKEEREVWLESRLEHGGKET